MSPPTVERDRRACEFGGSRCFTAGGYYKIRVVREFTEKLSEVVVLRSPALTANAAGPIADPCIKLAFMFLNSDV